MRPEETLRLWSDMCDQLGIRWYLYRETLLCAHGYHEFPDTLSYAQVAIYVNDLPKLLEDGIALLPAEWNYDRTGYTVGTKELCFKDGENVVLTVDVLCAAESEEAMERQLQTVKQTRTAIQRKGKDFRLMMKILCKLLRKTVRIRKVSVKEFEKVLTAMKNCAKDGAVYSDGLTSKDGLMMDQTLFSRTEMLSCDDVEYPVFCGYRDYLEKVYGDYEQGLFDDIGVGLTVEEKQELREHQKHCKEALAFLQALSEEFGLRYYLLAGSVLGPVREGGCIPWDDDIDVGIRIEDLEAFEAKVAEYLPKRLPQEFVLMQSGPDNPFPRMFSKICYNGRCCVDLWPLVPTYPDGIKSIWNWYFGKMITKVHYLKIGHPVKKFRKLALLVHPFMTDRMVMWMARRNERCYAGRSTPVYVNLYSIYRRSKEMIRREWLDHPVMVDYAGIMAPAPGCVEEYMVHLYGDYMTPPPPWKRGSRHFERFFKE